MKLNLYALVAVALMMISLFLPWISYSETARISNLLMGTMSVAYSPFQMSGNYIVWNASSSSVAARYVFHTRIQPTLLTLNVWQTSQGYLVFTFLASIFYLLPIILMIHACFATGSWSSIGRKVAIGSSNLSLLSISSYVLLGFWYLAGGRSDGIGEWMRNGGIAFYLNTGFWLAILGCLAAYASWLNPRFIKIRIEILSKKTKHFKRMFDVSEWEKLAIIATSSFLIIFVSTLVYFLVMPAEF